MKKINLLLGGGERSLTRVVEASVLDVCYDLAAVEATTEARLGQFARNGCLGSFDLMILIPDNLLPEPNLGGNAVPLDHVLDTIRLLKRQSPTPLIVLTANFAARRQFTDAGADAVVTEFYQSDRLKAEVRRLLLLPEPANERQPGGWSLAAIWLRGLQRLRRA